MCQTLKGTTFLFREKKFSRLFSFWESWGVISFSWWWHQQPRNYKKLCCSDLWSEVKSLSHVRLCATPWTVAYQAPLSMGFSRQEYWSGLLFPSPGIFLSQGLNSHLLLLLHWQADSLALRHLGNPFFEHICCSSDLCWQCLSMLGDLEAVSHGSGAWEP